MRGILSDRAIWYHGADGFYNIDHVDRAGRRCTASPSTASTTSFDLRSVVAGPARAVDRRPLGRPPAPSSTQLDGDELRTARRCRAEQLLDPRDARRLPRGAARARGAELHRAARAHREPDAQGHRRLALPGRPVPEAGAAVRQRRARAGRHTDRRAVRRHPSIAAIVGLGTAVGFGYWVLLGLTTSLGQSGALPPLVAAWAANAIFLLLGVALFLVRASERGATRSALRVLRPLARLVAPVLLALDLARITGHVAGLLQRRPELRVGRRSARG